MEMNELEPIATCDLVNELIKREAVHKIVVKYDEPLQVVVAGQSVPVEVSSGPATILVIWD